MRIEAVPAPRVHRIMCWNKLWAMVNPWNLKMVHPRGFWAACFYFLINQVLFDIRALKFLEVSMCGGGRTTYVNFDP